MRTFWKFVAWPMLWLVVVPSVLIVSLSISSPTYAFQEDCSYGQYRNAGGECACPAGTTYDRGPAWCVQDECPANGRYNSVKECICNEGFSPEWTTLETETGYVYELPTACVVPSASGSDEAGQADDGGFIIPDLIDLILPTPQRIRDAITSIREGGALEKVAGVASLAGAVAGAGLAVYGGGLAARAGGSWVMGRVAQAGLRRAAVAAASQLALAAEGAEVAAISVQTRAALVALVQAMRQAGMTVNPQNILNLINQARSTQNLHNWGMSNIQIILKGIGLG